VLSREKEKWVDVLGSGKKEKREPPYLHFCCVAWNELADITGKTADKEAA